VGLERKEIRPDRAIGDGAVPQTIRTVIVARISVRLQGIVSPEPPHTR